MDFSSLCLVRCLFVVAKIRHKIEPCKHTGIEKKCILQMMHSFSSKRLQGDDEGLLKGVVQLRFFLMNSLGLMPYSSIKCLAKSLGLLNPT